MAEMDAAMQIPGTTNAWTMPIKARIDMLTTGIRTPVGIKIFGADLKEIEAIGTRLEDILRGVPGTRSVFAERAAGGYFVDFDIDRDGAGPLRALGQRGPGRDHVGRRRRERHDDGRGPGAVPGERALSAGPARRTSTSSARCWS